MPRTVSKGPTRYVARSWWALLTMWVSTLLTRAVRGPWAPGWTLNFEVGNLFWRGQFNRAFAMSDIQNARTYFDSLMTWMDEDFRVPTISMPPASLTRAAQRLWSGSGPPLPSILAQGARMPLFKPATRPRREARAVTHD